MDGSPSKSGRHFFFTSLLCKTLRFCFVSIVKWGHILQFIFEKIKNNKKNNKNPKICFFNVFAFSKKNKKNIFIDLIVIVKGR
jgi:hypothetical protein